MSILLLGAGLGATQTRLLDYAPGASAAYSLRQVGRQYNGPVVRVRRESDSTERDFTASQIDNGTLTTWVNATPDLPLDQSAGAAAAYSLRNLSSSYSGNVIRARRASDNDERDFTANEIIDGTLTTWTNASVALPLDEASGAAAAYSLRNLSASYTGDVIRVRRTSDSAELDFSASEITDGTLESWVDTENIFYSADFSTGIGGWFEPYPYGTLTYNVDTDDDGSGVPPSDNWLKIECNAVGGRIYFSGNTALNNDIASLGGGDYKLEFDYYNPDSSFSFSNIYISSEPTRYWGAVPLSNGSGSYSQTLTLTEAEAVGITDFRFGSTSDTSGRTLYIKNLKITKTDANGYVKTWYDQSGNDNHATQTTAGYQPKIVSAGALITENSNPALLFDGSNDTLDATFPSFSEFTAALVCTNNADNTEEDRQDALRGPSGFLMASFVADNQYRFRSASTTLDYYTVDKVQHIHFATNNGATSSARVDGGAESTDSDTSPSGGAYQIGGNAPGGYGWSGTLQEVIVWPSDLTSQRTAIEANLAEFYGIDLPAGVDTANNEVDAFVTTWYDQSGNGNHAVQSTATYQPKIVNAGALITENGKPALQFDGVNDRYEVGFTLGAYISMFSVVSANATNDFIFDAYDNTNNNSIAVALSTHLRFLMTGTSVSGYHYRTYTLGSQAVLSMIHFSDAIRNAWVNGSDSGYIQFGGVPAPTPMNGISIGCAGNDALFFDGTYQELIIYDSDQSDFRQGIETNTALHYNIFTTMKYKVQSNEVDGYVATWYDQSGNGYDAAQTTADYQPKLVDSGAIIEENGEPALRFDGVNDYLRTVEFTQVAQPYSVFTLFRYLSGFTSSTRVMEFGPTALRSGEIIRNSTNGLHFYAGNITWQLNDLGGIEDYSIRYNLWDDSSSKLYENSIPYISNTSLGTNAASQITIGNNRISTTPSNIAIGELILYPFDQSSQRQRIEGNLAWKYNIEDKLPWDHPYARSFPGFGSQRVPTDSDTIAYLTAVSAADGVGVEVPIANAIEDFIVGCKADGIWDSIKASCILAGARSLEGALVPLVGAAPTNLPIADGFVGSDYSRTAGLTGDGTSYLNSGVANDSDFSGTVANPVNDNHNAAYVTAANTLAGGSYIGASLGLQGGANNLSSDPANTRLFTRNRSDAAELFVGKQSAVGLLGVSRSGAANYIARIEGSDTTINAASIGASPDNLFVFARNVGGSPNQTTDATIAFYSIGTSINLAQLDTRVSNLIASINLYLDIGLNPDNYDQDTINYIYNAYKAGGSLA